MENPLATRGSRDNVENESVLHAVSRRNSIENKGIDDTERTRCGAAQTRRQTENQRRTTRNTIGGSAMNPNHGTHARDTCCHGPGAVSPIQLGREDTGKAGKAVRGRTGERKRIGGRRRQGARRRTEGTCLRRAPVERARAKGESTDHVSRREEEQVREWGADREGRKGREGRAEASRLF